MASMDPEDGDGALDEASVAPSDTAASAAVPVVDPQLQIKVATCTENEKSSLADAIAAVCAEPSLAAQHQHILAHALVSQDYDDLQAALTYPIVFIDCFKEASFTTQYSSIVSRREGQTIVVTRKAELTAGIMLRAPENTSFVYRSAPTKAARRFSMPPRDCESDTIIKPDDEEMEFKDFVRSEILSIVQDGNVLEQLFLKRLTEAHAQFKEGNKLPIKDLIQSLKANMLLRNTKAVFQMFITLRDLKLFTETIELAQALHKSIQDKPDILYFPAFAHGRLAESSLPDAESHFKSAQEQCARLIETHKVKYDAMDRSQSSVVSHELSEVYGILGRLHKKRFTILFQAKKLAEAEEECKKAIEAYRGNHEIDVATAGKDNPEALKLYGATNLLTLLFCSRSDHTQEISNLVQLMNDSRAFKQRRKMSLDYWAHATHFEVNTVGYFNAPTIALATSFISRMVEGCRCMAKDDTLASWKIQTTMDNYDLLEEASQTKTRKPIKLSLQHAQQSESMFWIEFFRKMASTSTDEDIMVWSVWGKIQSRGDDLAVGRLRVSEGTVSDPAMCKFTQEPSYSRDFLIQDIRRLNRRGRRLEIVFSSKEDFDQFTFNFARESDVRGFEAKLHEYGYQPMVAAAKEMFEWEFEKRNGEAVVLGEGAFGKVYAAYRKDTALPLAAKEAKDGSELQDDKVHRELNPHENIVRYFGTVTKVVGIDAAGQEQRYHYALLERVFGGSLEDLVEQYGPIQDPYLGFYVRQIMLGLAYLHRNKIIHRDIKPENILVCQTDGTTKITDFGVSMCGGAQGGMTYTGTPAYMAPEVSDGSKYTLAVDIWSVGGTIAFIATGKLPVDGTAETIRQQISSGQPIVPKLQGIENKPLQKLLQSCLTALASSRPTIEEILKQPYFKNLPENVEELEPDKQLIQLLNTEGLTEQFVQAATTVTSAKWKLSTAVEENLETCCAGALAIFSAYANQQNKETLGDAAKGHLSKLEASLQQHGIGACEAVRMLMKAFANPEQTKQTFSPSSLLVRTFREMQGHSPHALFAFAETYKDFLALLSKHVVQAAPKKTLAAKPKKSAADCTPCLATDRVHGVGPSTKKAHRSNDLLADLQKVIDEAQRIISAICEQSSTAAVEAELAAFVSSAGCSSATASVLCANDIDFEVLTGMMTKADVMSLDTLPFGQRVRLWNAVERLRSSQSASDQ
eukprot:m.74741 g.74741  ORF g.74741 m.74741 type:complete len:1198 (+) comp12408_c0_seq1:95-3688(+)